MSAVPQALLARTHGILLISTFLSTILYGLTGHQTFRYYRRYSKDRLSLRILVATLALLDTLYTVFSIHWCYYYLIQSFGNGAPLFVTTWSLRMGVILTFVIGQISNMFYLTRLYMIGLHIVAVLAILLTMILPRFGFELAMSVQIWIDYSFRHTQKFRWMITVIFGFATASNTALAVALCYILQKKRTGYAGTNSTIDMLVIYTINTGVLTSFLTFVGLFAAIFWRDGLLYLGMLSLVTKIYVNSVLAVLNSRKQMASKLDESVYELGAFEYSLGGTSKPERHQLTFARSNPGQTETIGMDQIEVHVSETKTFHRDDSDGLSHDTSNRTSAENVKRDDLLSGDMNSRTLRPQTRA